MTYKKKLIEVAIPLAAINRESAKQKTMGAAPHPQNLHRWWARRPLAAARAVLFAQLVDDPSSHPDIFPSVDEQETERRRLFAIMERLIPYSASHNETILNEARAEILKSCEGQLPSILDPFGGGGAIPLESTRLGLPTFSGDLNPVAVTIQRAMIEIPHRFSGRAPVNPRSEPRAVWQRAEGLAADVEYFGNWMEARAKERIGEYYPHEHLGDGLNTVPIAWIWARTVESPDPSWAGHVPLVRSWELARKTGQRPTWIEPVIDRDNGSITYAVRTSGTAGPGTVNRGHGTCIVSGAAITGEYIKSQANAGRMGQVLLAIVCESASGRTYVSPTSHDGFAVPESIAPISGEVPRHLTGGTCAVYGLDDWSKLYTARQLLALTTFSDLLNEVPEQVDKLGHDFPDDVRPLRDGGTGRQAYAEAIVTYLAFAVDRCADYWSSICSWNINNQQIRETFSKQAIPMTWDFVEANPFSKKMASWDSMLKTVVKGIQSLPTVQQGQTAQRDARARIEEVGQCVISTDPPYYDNISYADLSDLFYVWLRRGTKAIWPDEMSTIATPKIEELIANRYRAGSKEAAHAHFEFGMQGVFSKASEFADDRFPSTIFYAFRATEDTDEGQVSTGWETFLAGLIEAGFLISATWPIRTELANKIGVGAGHNMLASSIVLACRKRPDDAPMATRGEFLAALRRELPEAIRLLQMENIAPVDMAQSAIGPGMKVFSQFSKVVEMGGGAMSVRMALILINEVLSEILTGEESELDSDTRFALTWFEQFGHNPGPFGDADVLARAKDTTVNGVCASGIAASRDGKVWLVERQDLPSDWNPTTDARLTVWEITQHLIRALESSEAEAATILRKVGGGFGDRAKQLAYLLYGICEKKGWAQEAGPYDMLIRVWPDLLRRAASDDVPPRDDKDTGQGEFDFGDDE